MRVFSFAQESTRFCNYSKDKFENEVTFILPIWLNTQETNFGTIDNPEQIQFTKWSDLGEREFINHLLNTEYRYFELLNNNWTAQQARSVLPNSLKTELVMTGFLKDWLGRIVVTNLTTGVELVFSLADYEKMDEEKEFPLKEFSIRREGFFPLRTHKTAHPQARELACPLWEEFKNKGLV